MLFLFALASAAEPVVATVDGVAITQAEYDAAAATIPNLVPEMKPQLVDRLVEIQLLSAEAKRRKLGSSKSDKLRLQMAKKEALASLAVDAYVKENTTDDKVKAWYDAHSAVFARPQARAHHILVKTEAEAAALTTRLGAGEAFEALADEASIDPSARSNHGDLGWFERDQMVEPFGAAAFDNPAGALVTVQTQYGWHVVRVDGRRDVIPLDEVKEEIRGQMHDELLDAWIAELKGKSKIETK